MNSQIDLLLHFRLGFGTGSSFGGSRRRGNGVHPFQNRALGGVPLTLAELDDAGVTATAILEGRRDFGEQGLGGGFLMQAGDRQATMLNSAFFPSVTIFSATERAALALAKEVVTRLCSIRLQTRLASIALRCSEVRPSLAVRFKCLMAIPYSVLAASSFGASTMPGSKFMPSERLRETSLSLISLSDFLPKLRYFSISCSVFSAS